MKIPPSTTLFDKRAEFLSNLTHATVDSDAMCSHEAELWRQAVELWMQWHAAQQRLTTAMFDCRHDPAQQAELIEEMDQLDQLRWRAVEISQELLSTATV